jgi:hypothetical protein
MKCDDIRQILGEIDDTKASKRKAKAARLHLERCRGCQIWLEKHREFENHLTMNTSDILFQIKMPANLFSQIEHKISKMDKAPGKQTYSKSTFFQQLKYLIPQTAFRFASILISVLLFYDVLRGFLDKG